LNELRFGVHLINKVFKNGMIIVDNHLGAQEIRLKFLNGKDNYKELLLSGCVILLVLIKCLASVIDNIGLLVTSLTKNRPNCIITSITHNFEWKTLIGRLNNRSGNESSFNPVKILKTLIRKDEWGIFGQKQSEGLSNFRKILNETPIKTRMPKEASHPFHTSGRW